jgi:hypothetical protein
LVNYLNGLKKEIGLLINFSPNGVEVKRKYKSNNIDKQAYAKDRLPFPLSSGKRKI